MQPVIPQHIAIIMDGNNRYAHAHQLGFGQGHVAGKKALDPIVEHARAIGVKALTVFAFSSENWQREQDEVALLMDLLTQTIHEQVPRMHQHDIALKFIGDRSKLSPHISELMARAEASTAMYQGMTLVIALSYGGQWDITRACKRIAQQVENKQLAASDITEQLLQGQLSTHGLPAVDLLIRTGGELRLSNFMLWQAAYAELVFSDKLWPEFTPHDLDQAIASFAQRSRRFGQSGKY